MGKEKHLTGLLPIRERGLIAIKSLLKELDASDAEILRYEIKDGRIVLTPQIAVDKDQAWFWSKHWQEGEKKAESDKVCGRSKRFSSVNELMDDLLDGLEIDKDEQNE